MNAYMRGFVILFVLLVLLSYLPPGKQYRKYIRFYAQLLMVLAALRPLFVLFGGKDTFYEKMAYAQCMEKLSEFSRDTQKIAYLNQDRYRTEYENVIAENIREKVDDMLQEYGLGAESVTVERIIRCRRFAFTSQMRARMRFRSEESVCQMRQSQGRTRRSAGK